MNIEKIRQDFPFLRQKLAYLDSACMSLKPLQVMDAMNKYYTEFPSCGERSSHRLGKLVTEEFESARKTVAEFIGAKPDEIIFTKNTTEGLNIAAYSLLEKGDGVITTDKEHNSNFLPWTNFNHIILRTINGMFDIKGLESALGKDVKIVAVSHTSNIDGASFPIKEIAKITHDNNSILVVDGAQAVPHKEIDVRQIGIDVMAFSGHKMLGPSIGILYIRKDLLENMKTFIVGGGTVQNVKDGKPQYLKGPHAFEAGLQNYAGAIGLKAAIHYLQKIGMKNIQKHEADLNEKMAREIQGIRGVEIFGPEQYERSSILSFNIRGIDPREGALMFDSCKVLIRGGMHCCHHYFNSRNMQGTLRASIYLYNDEDDIEMFSRAVKAISKFT